MNPLHCMQLCHRLVRMSGKGILLFKGTHCVASRSTLVGQMKQMKTARWLAFLAVVISGSAAAQDAKLEVVGTGDGFEILRALADRYSKTVPNVRVEIPPSIGSGGGIAAVVARRAELGRIARKLSNEEREAGIVYTPIASLPSAFFTHPSAGVQSLTFIQLVEIYAGRVTNWKEVGGTDIRIRVICREDIDSTLVVLRSSMPGWKTLEITERSKIATSTQEAIETARRSPGAIAFGPYEIHLESGLQVLKIEGMHPLDKNYPSKNELALIHLNQSISAPAAEFLKFSVAEKAQQIISEHGGVPASK